MLTRAITAVVILTAGITPAKAESLYQIGNSLTLDSTPPGIAQMAASAGIDFSGGYHVRSNSTLGMIWDNPQSVNAYGGEYGTFPLAVPNNAWDHIALQPSDDASSTTAGDQEFVERYIELAETNPANADTQYYVYGAAPWYTRYNAWDRPASDDPDEPTWNRRYNYYALMDRLNESSPGQFRLIPVGEVFATMIDRLDGEAFGGYTSINRFYRDIIHLNGRGSFVAATTVLATVFKVNPIGLPVPRTIPGWGKNNITDELALELQELVWEVVVDEKRTGVSPLGDLNVDTVVDQADYELWRDSFGYQENLSADANGDGVVDEADAQVWLAASQPGAADIDGDGAVGDADYQAWRAAFGSAEETAADANDNGVVDAADYTLWRDQLGLVELADFNGDGVADGADNAILQSELGWALDLSADGNEDGVVNAADYTVWRDGLAAAASTAAAVPEPTGAVLALLALGGSPVRRR